MYMPHFQKKIIGTLDERQKKYSFVDFRIELLIMRKFLFDRMQYNRSMLCVQRLSNVDSFVDRDHWMAIA